MKLLAIDIGNTTINFGFFENEKLISKIRIIPSKFRKIPAGRRYDAAIISSVVPNLTAKVKKNLKNAVVVDYKNIPIKIKLKTPHQAGADRLVNAVAAKQIYGCPAVVVDLGTATTFDIISKKGEYLGGVIAPGLQMSVDSLCEKTAKLPRVNLQNISNCSIIGKDTKKAILSGIVFGHIGLIKEVIGEIKNQSRQGGTNIKYLNVILTGGYAGFFSKYFKHSILDEDLTLKGLQIIFDKFSCFHGKK